MQEQIAMIKTYIYDVADKINKAGKDALNGFAPADELHMKLMGINRFTKVQPFNAKSARQAIAIFFVFQILENVFKDWNYKLAGRPPIQTYFIDILIFNSIKITLAQPL